MPGAIRRLVNVTCAIVCAVTFVAVAPARAADDLPQGFYERVYHDGSGDHRYTIFVPTQYAPEFQWPVILYLHGASARGTDNRLPIVDGLGPQIRARASTFPFLVVFPQCEDVNERHLEAWSAHTADAQRALRILDAVERDYSVDRRREILTGPSMGAAGVWSIACASASRWSAIVPVSGGGNPAEAGRLKNVPVWAFHGEKDLAVPIAAQERMVDALRAAGGRAHLTVLPGARHIIAHVVYGDDAVYDWMLNPTAEPREDGIVQNSLRKPTSAELGFDINTSFVPAAVIPQAAYVRIGTDAIDALTYSLPELLPQSSLTGSIGGVHRTGKTAGMTFNLDVSGMNYRGEIERIKLDTRRDGWAVLRIGLRNLTMEIPQSHLNGRLVSATAGPMYVEVGRSRAIWLSVPLRPYVDEGRIRFQMRSPEFQIPFDEYHVTTPQVEAHGLPIIKGRVSNNFQQQLVRGAYDRKRDVEQLVIRAVPALLEKLEWRLDQQWAVPRTIGGWPAPALQPRYKVWADAVRVDADGITLVVGLTISKPGLDPAPSAIRRVERRTLSLDEIPSTKGLQVGITGGFLEGITAAMIAGNASSSNLLDLNPAGFAPFGDARQMAEFIPDLARYNGRLRVRTRSELVEPIAVRSSDTAASLEAAGGWSRDRSLGKSFTFVLPKIRLSVDIKTAPEPTSWIPCAEIELSLRQQLQMQLEQPDFERRLINVQPLGHAEVAGMARFVDGYRPRDPQIEADRILKTFAAGWRTGGQMELLRGIDAEDLTFAGARFRVVDVAWLDPFSVRFYTPAHTRITNRLTEPIEYDVRSPMSSWGGPYRLEPGQSHEFSVPYAPIIRYRTNGGEQMGRLQVGSDSTIGPMQLGYGNAGASTE